MAAAPAAEPVEDRFDVVVSGASFAGLALARALSLGFGADARICVIDRVAELRMPAADPRAFALSAASKRMLDALGVWPRLADDAQPVAEIEITDSSLDAGVRPVLLTYDNVVDGAEPASFIVPAALLARALEAIVAADPNVELLVPAEAASFRSGAAGVEISLADRRSIRAAVLVAAEGRRSALRDAAGIKIVTWSYGQTGIVTTIGHDRPHNGRAVQHFLPAGPFAILPLKSRDGHRSCITWTEEASEAERILALNDAAFLGEVEKRVGGRLGALTLAGSRRSWPLEMHLARSYVAPRFVVIGDAAHVVHPIAGQGLNLALRDVAALAEVLADAARLGLDLGNWESLKSYERWRRFDSALSAATFDGLNRLFSNDWALVRAARDFGLGLVDRTPSLKQLFVAEAAGLSGELPRLLRGEPL
jgi:2-octaprenyl-6-methoxyphenol hydroxylase